MITEEIKFNAKDVIPYLRAVCSVTDKKTSMPILDCFHIKATSDNLNALCVTAADTDNWLSMNVPVESVSGAFEMCINARDMVRSLGNLGDKNVTMEVNYEEKRVLFTYDNGSFILPISVDEFPHRSNNKDDARTIVISSNIIVTAIKRCEFAIADDTLRPIMNCVHFDFFDDGMVSVATDGRKLVKYKDSSVVRSDGERVIYNFNLNSRPSIILSDILKGMDNTEVRVTFDDSMVMFENDTFRLTSRAVDGNYPNYDSVIPKVEAHKTRAYVNRNDVVEALRHTTPFASDMELMKMSFSKEKETLIVCVEDIDYGKHANEKVSCYLEGDNITIGFKGSIILGCLQNMTSERVCFEMTDSKHACILYEVADDEEQSRAHFLQLIMPMMLVD